MKQVLLYLPVIHAGYEAFLRRHADAAEILLLGTGFTAAYPSLAKDIRALPRGTGRPATSGSRCRRMPASAWSSRRTWPPRSPATPWCCPTRRSCGTSRTATTSAPAGPWCSTGPSCAGTGTGPPRSGPVTFDGEITVDELPRELLGRAQAAGRAQLGLVAAGGRGRRPGGRRCSAAPGTTISPTEYAPYLDGDPRDAFERGVRADLSTAIHAEAAV